MKEASHTKSTASSLRLLPDLGLVDVADPSLLERLAGKASEQLELFASPMRQGLLAASVVIGLDVMGELVDTEVTALAGPKGRHDPNRTAYRHGTEDGKVTFGGRRIPVRRPRVRTLAGADEEEHEVRLESYDTLAGTVAWACRHSDRQAWGGDGSSFSSLVREFRADIAQRAIIRSEWERAPGCRANR
jgi:hypothetical protein